MTDDKLTAFVTAAKERGLDDTSLVPLLRQQGFQEQRIYRALAGYYSEHFGIDVPSRGNRAEDARDAFYHLLAFATLGAWVVALIQLAYTLVDRHFGFGAPNYDIHQISWSLATIIIALPIYLWVNVLIGNEAQRRPESLQSGVRKWLTYIALVVAAGVLIGDGIWFLGSFLNGDLTMAFIMKSGVVVVLTGGIFAYYLGGMRSSDLPVWRTRLYGAAACIAAITALAFGFASTGSPMQQQALARDHAVLYTIDQRANDAIRLDVPKRLAGATPAEYRRIDATHFVVCGTFEQASTGTDDPMWKHAPGNACFTLSSKHSPAWVPQYQNY